jgi:acyl carrier protein
LLIFIDFTDKDSDSWDRLAFGSWKDMKTVDQNTIDEIRKTVYDYFADECEVEIDEISDDTNIISDLEGDSLMLLALLEIFRKKYELSIELKTLGKHLMKKPAETIGQVIDLTEAIVRYGNDIVNVEL